MMKVFIALGPAAAFGVALYGIPAIFTILVSVSVAVLAEGFFRRLARQSVRSKDPSAALSGLILGLILPPGMPLWMVALGSAFAIIVAKEFFGGLGANVFNPALAGRVFLVMSFPAAATTWAVPRTFFGVPDAVTAATPMFIINAGDSISDVGAMFASMGFSWGSDYWSTIGALFLGTHGGSIGESSVLLIFIGFIFLLVTRTINWRAPVSMLFAVFTCTFLFGGDPLFAILTGGVFFGAVFMVTDYVTSPLTANGKIIFGLGVGLITVLIRQLGNYQEGVAFAILLMNAVVPFLDRLLLQKKYGYVKRPKGGGQ